MYSYLVGFTDVAFVLMTSAQEILFKNSDLIYYWYIYKWLVFSVEIPFAK